jgi:hypothetical protein
MVAGLNPLFFKSTGFTSSTFPIQPDFSQNQPAVITLNTGSPWTLQKANMPVPKHKRQLTTWQVCLSSREEIS